MGSDLIEIHRDRVAHTSNTDFPGHQANGDEDFSLEALKRKFDVKLHHLNDTYANFDLIGIDTSLANAFRRIMIAEVPSVAVESVFIEMNTSVIHDEVLASRIGLVPIMASPDLLEWLPVEGDIPVNSDGQPEPHNAANTVVFELDVKCERNPNAPRDSTDPNELYINSNVYARDLVYLPQGDQDERFATPPAVGNPDILLCKLRPGQEIKLRCFAVLGFGHDHAKFSPVATASYRLMPSIEILEPIPKESVEKFQQCFSPGVVDIDHGRAVVVDPRKDTVSREVLRHPEFADKVRLGRKRDHFIFNIESTGAMQPDEIFVKSIQILRNKAADLLNYEL